MSEDGASTRRQEAGRRLGFKRHFVWPGVIASVIEIVFVVVPLLNLFGDGLDEQLLLQVVVPVLAGAQVVWWLATGSWLSAVYRAIQEKRRGNRLGGDLAAAAYRTTIRAPLYALILRTVLWAVSAALIGFFFTRFASWPLSKVMVLIAAAAVLGFAAAAIRSFWYMLILARLRYGLFASIPVIRVFTDSYRFNLVFAAVAVTGATASGTLAFVYFSLPIDAAKFTAILASLPACVAVVLAGVVAHTIRRTEPITRFLRRHLEPDPDDDIDGGEDAIGPTAVYRLSQSLPYRLAAAAVTAWVLIGALIAYGARSRFGFELDDSILLVGIIVVIALGSSLYQAIWYRELIRPLLDHLTVSHRLPIRGIRPALSLRGKLLLSFGGMVLFACGLALFWGFIQYKRLATESTTKQAELGLAWLRSEVVAASVGRQQPPTPELVGEVLRGAERQRPDSSAVLYYMPPGGAEARLLKLGGGLMGAPDLPWYVRAQLQLSGDHNMSLSSHSLFGRRGRLAIAWRGEVYDLGAIAVFYPNYRGRGVTMVPELRELLLFFLVLFGTCAGIVLLTVAQFVKPIRRLEKRADGMARGELARPVSSGGEGDEIGRLTFALEEMRRALREKLRSTEEVNLDLERAVQRRTADLAKKNRELAETLEKLTRAQDQLVRSEKMASIGQLVAGIAHEINNPVNAIVNTIGPLSEVVEIIEKGTDAERAEAVDDVADMLRVVRRGAERTKAIVSALHNYSRTDEESVVDVDLNRSLDDSLELLRHLLKQSISVVKNYGDVGRIRGHAGQLNQVFVNLIANAAQAVGGRDGAEITIETSESAGMVVICIRDNGSGIPADVLPRIFDPFFTTKDVGEGSGLGLSIVHGIVERHGGTIEVDSEPGVGTVFTIALPRLEDAIGLEANM